MKLRILVIVIAFSTNEPFSAGVPPFEGKEGRFISVP